MSENKATEHPHAAYGPEQPVPPDWFSPWVYADMLAAQDAIHKVLEEFSDPLPTSLDVSDIARRLITLASDARLPTRVAKFVIELAQPWVDRAAASETAKSDRLPDTEVASAMLATATGEDLDEIAAILGHEPRHYGEADRALRRRLQNV